MGTRKNHKSKKPNKRFRRTRSKRQRGGNSTGELLQAIEDDNANEIMEILLDNDGDVDVNAHAQGVHLNQTALTWASFKGSKPIVEILLSTEGTDVNKTNSWQHTALMNASLKGHTEIMEILLNHGAKSTVDNQDQFGTTALMMASVRGETDAINILLDAGADVNRGSTDRRVRGETSLHRAAHTGKIESARLLLNRGADINAITARNDTPIKEARNWNKDDMVEFLIKKGAEAPDEPYYNRIKNKIRREELMTAQVLRQRLRVDPATVSGLMNQHLDMNSRRGGKRKTKKRSKRKNRKTRRK